MQTAAALAYVLAYLATGAILGWQFLKEFGYSNDTLTDSMVGVAMALAWFGYLFAWPIIIWSDD